MIMYAGFIVKWQKGSTTHTHTHHMCSPPSLSVSSVAYLSRGDTDSHWGPQGSDCLLVFKYLNITFLLYRLCVRRLIVLKGIKINSFIHKMCFYFLDYLLLTLVSWCPRTTKREQGRKCGSVINWVLPKRIEELITLNHGTQASCSMISDNMRLGASEQFSDCYGWSANIFCSISQSVV